MTKVLEDMRLYCFKCGKRSLHRRYVAGIYEYHRCLECGSIKSYITK